MKSPRFFGYGSLVNIATHDYPNPRPATLKGWRREWRHTTLRDVAYLSIMPDPDSTISGVVADVPDGDWAALDLRETAYVRHEIPRDRLNIQGAAALGVSVYQTRLDCSAAEGNLHPIYLSYLDVVVQGFLNIYGESGVTEFFDTTSGWETVILDDRAAPRYPRHQQLSADETARVDAHRRRLSAHVKQIHEPGVT